jgi:hypothetical protein
VPPPAAQVGNHNDVVVDPVIASSPSANCDARDHLIAHCPTIRCEKCGKLGHICAICQALMPWEFADMMFGFQAPGCGFFTFLMLALLDK